MPLDVGSCSNVLFDSRTKEPSRNPHRCLGDGAFLSRQRQRIVRWRINDRWNYYDWWSEKLLIQFQQNRRGWHKRSFQIHGTRCSCWWLRIQNHSHNLAEEIRLGNLSFEWNFSDASILFLIDWRWRCWNWRVWQAFARAKDEGRLNWHVTWKALVNDQTKSSWKFDFRFKGIEGEYGMRYHFSIILRLTLQVDLDSLIRRRSSYTVTSQTRAGSASKVSVEGSARMSSNDQILGRPFEIGARNKPQNVQPSSPHKDWQNVKSVAEVNPCRKHSEIIQHL